MTPQPPPTTPQLDVGVRWAGIGAATSVAVWLLLDILRIPIPSGAFLMPTLWVVAWVWLRVYRALQRVPRAPIAFPGEPLARWTVDGERWASFIRKEPAEPMKYGRVLLAVAMAILLLPSAALFADVDDTLRLFAWVSLTLASMLLAGLAYSIVVPPPVEPPPPEQAEVVLWATGGQVGTEQFQWKTERGWVECVHVDVRWGRLWVYWVERIGRRGERRQYSHTHAAFPFPVGAEDDARGFAYDIIEACQESGGYTRVLPLR